MESLNLITELAACPTIPVTSSTDHGQTPRAHQTLSFPQIAASGKKVTQKAKTQQEIIAEAVRKPIELVRYCGACSQKGHELRDCTRKVDVYGFQVGCPLCNTTKHNIDQCQGRPARGNQKAQRPNASTLWYVMVVRRAGKPPLRSARDFRFLNPEKWALLDRYPQTCQFAAARKKAKIFQAVDEQVQGPSWANPESIGSQVHPLDVSAAQFSSAAGTLNHLPAQQLHSEKNSAAKKPSSHGQTASDFKIESASNSPLLQSTATSGAMVHGYQNQREAAQPHSPLENPHHQVVNHAVLPSTPDSPSISQTSSFYRTIASADLLGPDPDE